MALTDAKIRSLTVQERAFKIADFDGLYLLVNPNGSKLWRLKYRIGGAEKLLSIGAYPSVTLATARQVRDDARAQLASGGDPPNGYPSRCNY
ncbi:Arm DNA-binding domain-containing protein [Pseudogemmobacter sp. W21_MBD1_M6]|uniref:Arm DNA-binding domain-containing protein n=1 Tax=Pseudogemmobacter sp. W21_MBD1_M6 TaxID=3240271 RepID=UPI003F94E690